MSILRKNALFKLVCEQNKKLHVILKTRLKNLFGKLYEPTRTEFRNIIQLRGVRGTQTTRDRENLIRKKKISPITLVYTDGLNRPNLNYFLTSWRRHTANNITNILIKNAYMHKLYDCDADYFYNIIYSIAQYS